MLVESNGCVTPIDWTNNPNSQSYWPQKCVRHGDNPNLATEIGFIYLKESVIGKVTPHIT